MDRIDSNNRPAQMVQFRGVSYHQRDRRELLCTSDLVASALWLWTESEILGGFAGAGSESQPGGSMVELWLLLIEVQGERRA